MSKFRNVAILFILATWTLEDRIATEYIVLLMMMMKGMYLIALMGKNLPVLFSSEGLLQMMRWSLWKIPFFLYSSSHISSSVPSSH